MRTWFKFISIWCLTQALSAAPLQQAQPWLGVAVDEKGTGGVLVKSLISQAPAEKAGLQIGDLITAIDDTNVKNRDELLGVLRAKGVGNSVVVHFNRQGKDEKKTLKLEALPDRVQLMERQLLNKPVPAFSLENVADGKTNHQKDLLGKVVILEFWATWCPACRAAIPRLNQWSKAHKNISIIGITDEGTEVVKAFLQKEKMDYTVAMNKSQTDFQVGSIPTFVLVDSKGVVRALAMGAGDYLESLLQQAERLKKGQ
jgi:thiol-disulfide isomerase/thioredoxin